MYPDFGNECFWCSPSGAVCTIDEFEPYILQNSKLYFDIQEWCYDFQHCAIAEFDWDAFTEKGQELYKKLVILLDTKYIIEYQQSYEETCYRKSI